MSKPELIVKHVYGWSDGYHLGLRPGFCLLGNRTGLEWLAEHLNARAAQIDEDSAYNPDAPDDVEDLWETVPWNHQLSDEVHLTLGVVADRHHARALSALNVTPSSQRTGPPMQQWARMLTEMADWIEAHWAAEYVLSVAGPGQVADSFQELAEVAAAVARRVRDQCSQISPESNDAPDDGGCDGFP